MRALSGYNASASFAKNPPYYEVSIFVMPSLIKAIIGLPDLSLTLFLFHSLSLFLTTHTLFPQPP